MLDKIKESANNAETLDPITVDDVDRGIKELKSNTALGLDQWEVAWLKAMPPEAKESLATLLNMVEACGSWPTHILANTIILMGKPTGGSRPIALMPMLYRIWTKARKKQIQEWDSEECRTSGSRVRQHFERPS